LSFPAPPDRDRPPLLSSLDRTQRQPPLFFSCPPFGQTSSVSAAAPSEDPADPAHRTAAASNLFISPSLSFLLRCQQQRMTEKTKNQGGRPKGRRGRLERRADRPTVAAVDDTAGVEMKEEEGGCRSNHPHVWSVGGACNQTELQIQQT